MKNCAIYTRVSTDMQAEKEYNSCKSQEDKIRSYINSQEGWKIYDVYSDEGFTGANLNRPAFQRLISDLKNIDIIIFYKLDRLTRSPRDFYNLAELFEKSAVDFISITEHYDTSTPSGRLLMNIMLTFAQFERELTSERVKDKMIERAKKGMWNGGTVPLGYIKKNKSLLVDTDAARIVREIYNGYVNTKSAACVYNYVKDNCPSPINKAT